MEETPKKNERAEKEEETLKFWKERNIFDKSLKKDAPNGDFVFYEGPPTPNGCPGMHHLMARAFKDVIPRFKTMQGYHVRRKGGWDTHGLPVEIAVEKELELKSKKGIEEYGVAKFNEKCKESVWKYINEWEQFTDRIGYWVDQDNPYVTYHTNYIESVWNIVKKVDEKGLLYKDHRIVPWCPRCETALSSHEIAQGYETVKELSVYVKFKVKGEENTHLLVWTTTPWTLLGNVALAIGKDIDYVKVNMGGDFFILAKEKTSVLPEGYKIIDEMKGSVLVGLPYEPIYNFISSKKDIKDYVNAFKVYPADFVTTEEGTGIVHIATMYGQDDFELGKKIGLPNYHLVGGDGRFTPETGEYAEKFVKDEETTISIIKDLASRNLLFKKEKYEHSYPHCWRCKTPLIYYARDSWYIRMSELRDELVKENKYINWEPSHIKEGRFGEWLREVKDWAISRERYWGTPLPIWECEKCDKRTTIGSLDELKQKTDSILTKIIVVRHGESEKNIKDIFDSTTDASPLTSKGKKEAKKTGETLSMEKIDHLYFSPVRRTRETAKLINKKLNAPSTSDDDLAEIYSGKWDGKTADDSSISNERNRYLHMPDAELYVTKRGETGESWKDLNDRTEKFLKKIIEAHKGETVVVVTHQGNLIYILRYLEKLEIESVVALFKKEEYARYAHPFSFFVDVKRGCGADVHRPFVDTFKLKCECGSNMIRVKEVMDVWFDSGAMPYAQNHFPFENLDDFNPQKGLFKKQKEYPADFISEAIDQTRGWFYTLHAIGVILGYGKAYKNVVCLGHLLDEKGKKMSKSVGNVVNPWTMINKYGVDVLRFWMYSVNQPGESKNFDEKTIDEIAKKVFNLFINSFRFYEMYKDDEIKRGIESTNILDMWILSSLNRLTRVVTEGLENYNMFFPTREIREFIGDLSQWYVRRSRERFKNDERKKEALATFRYVLFTLSKLMAPITPFIAEEVYQGTKEDSDPESVHLTEWPHEGLVNEEILENMKRVREIVSDGLLRRIEAKIKVRQPIASVFIQTELDKNYQDLIKDELNTKTVITQINQDTLTRLDTTITKGLKEEGYIRELIRNVQELRKKENYISQDRVTIFISTSDITQTMITAYKDMIISATNTKEILFDRTEGETFNDGDISYTLSLKK